MTWLRTVFTVSGWVDVSVPFQPCSLTWLISTDPCEVLAGRALQSVSPGNLWKTAIASGLKGRSSLCFGGGGCRFWLTPPHPPCIPFVLASSWPRMLAWVISLFLGGEGHSVISSKASNPWRQLVSPAAQKCALGASSFSYRRVTQKWNFWLHKDLLNWNLQFNKILRWFYAQAHQFENPWFLSLILYPSYPLESRYRTLKKKMLITLD